MGIYEEKGSPQLLWGILESLADEGVIERGAPQHWRLRDTEWQYHEIKSQGDCNE